MTEQGEATELGSSVARKGISFLIIAHLRIHHG